MKDGFQKGVEHHQAGRFGEAEKAYKTVLASDPKHADALSLLGLIEIDANRFDDARAHLEKAVALRPEVAIFHDHLGRLFAKLGEDASALRSFRQAIALKPDFAEAYFHVGAVLAKIGQHLMAKTAFERAITLNPQAGGAYNGLGGVLRALSQLDAALAAFDRAAGLLPGNAIPFLNASAILKDQGRLTEAIEMAKKAIALDPTKAAAHSNLGVASGELGRTDDALAAFRKGLALEPNHSTMRSNFLFMMHYQKELDPAELYREHRVFDELPRARAVDLPRILDPNRKLRVGYISPDFRTHSVAYFIEPILTACTRSAFEIYAYSDDAVPDALTQRIAGKCDVFRPISGKTDAELAGIILDDNLDILVDLSGHTAKNRMTLFARRVAPLQFTYLGYPDTTGLSTMDYRITDAWADPPEADQFHSEKLARLPSGFLCYQPSVDAPEVGPLPFLTAGHVTFGSFNHLSKINDGVIAAWSEILLAVPGSRMKVKGKGLDHPQVMSSFRERFAGAGIGPARVDLLGAILGQRGHLALYGEIDIALDTYPYCGTTTTCEALWMGIPVVTRAGRVHASRVGVSLLSRVGHPEWIAQDIAGYRRIAVELASDRDRLAAIRASLRDDLSRSTLLDGKVVTAEIEAVYRRAWVDYCEREKVAEAKRGQ